MPIFDPQVARLRAAAAAMTAQQADVRAAGPWPLADHFGVEPEAAWGPPEVLAHVTEMLPFWLGEIERIIDGHGQPVPFGRQPSDPLRLGVIGRDRTLPIRELFARVGASAERFERRLPELSPEDAARPGLHPTLGEMTVEQIVDRFVVSHVEEHVVQLRSLLEEAGTTATPA